MERQRCPSMAHAGSSRTLLPMARLGPWLQQGQAVACQLCSGFQF